MSFIVDNNGKDPPTITEIHAITDYLDIAARVVAAAETLVRLQEEIDEGLGLDTTGGLIDSIFDRLRTVAVDLILAAEPVDPDGRVERVFRGWVLG
jgi:hypothetical protein